MHRDLKLHIGCGEVIHTGWINVDRRSVAGVDIVLDLAKGLPFRDVNFIFCEHFIEHLEFESALRLLRDCRSALLEDGILRLSTPNLDWVWMTQYHLGAWSEPWEAVRDCFWMNKAFRGWGHRFLYNAQTLNEVLIEAGFAKIEHAEYGHSRHPELCNLERHEKYEETPDLPHVIIVEASGRAEKQSTLLAGPVSDYRNAMID